MYLLNQQPRRTLLALALLLGACSADNNSNPHVVQEGGVVDARSVDAGADSTPDIGATDLAPPDQAIDAAPAGPWKELPNPATVALRGVWGSNAQDIFAVGQGGLILHYNGSAWATMTNSSNKDLYSVFGFSSGEVYAVGDGVVLAFDGGQWSECVASDYFLLRAIWSKSNSKVWTVGLEGTILHGNAKTSYWGSATSGTTKDLFGLWGVSGTEMYAVGAQGTILKYDGIDWTPMSSGVSSDLRAIWGTSSSDIFAVGLDGTVIHYDGSKWNKMDLNSSSYFYGVWGSSSSDVFVVGHPLVDQTESIFHYDGSTWNKLSPAKHSKLNAVWGASPTEVFAVGNFNILQYVGGN